MRGCTATVAASELSFDDTLQETSARYTAVEPSSGSNGIPRRATVERCGTESQSHVRIPGLTFYPLEGESRKNLYMSVVHHRGTSLIRNSSPPQDHHRALGIFLVQGPRGALSRMSKVPL